MNPLPREPELHLEAANGVASSSGVRKDGPAAVEVVTAGLRGPSGYDGGEDVEANNEREGLVSNVPRSSDEALPAFVQPRRDWGSSSMCPKLLGGRPLHAPAPTQDVARIPHTCIRACPLSHAPTPHTCACACTLHTHTRPPAHTHMRARAPAHARTHLIPCIMQAVS